MQLQIAENEKDSFMDWHNNTRKHRVFGKKVLIFCRVYVATSWQCFKWNRCHHNQPVLITLMFDNSEKKKIYIYNI